MTSDEYFDKYLFEADPALLLDVATALSGLLPSEVDAVAARLDFRALFRMEELLQSQRLAAQASSSTVRAGHEAPGDHAGS